MVLYRRTPGRPKEDLPMEQPPLVRHMRQIARSYDLDALLRDISAALAAAPEQDRPFVPQALAKALHQFIDSYGPEPQSAGDARF
jgi:hypothetical protein